ncbi:MAG: DUF4038 domain-containing protein [Pirellulales bacterium]
MLSLNRVVMCCLLSSFVLSSYATSQSPQVRVSENKRFLVDENNRPFFYLGDTVWELFHRASRADAEQYLQDRAAKGFTVIQAVALAEFDGITVPNANGHLPLIDNDPARPAVKDGPDNDYWDHVDAIVRMANAKGLVVGLLPTWGDKWNKKWGTGPEIFTPENAEEYGRWIGARYRDAGLIWILGGDRPIENDTQRAIIENMARGITAGDGGRHLKTFHPTGGQGSSQYFHDAPWLDFNMRQNGHGAEYSGRYENTLKDYNRTPTKPVLDGEPIYEDHPINFKAPEFGHSTSTDVRRPLYWNLFNGACGHTYGHHSVWQLWTEDRKPVNNPLMPWTKAIDQPGAVQMQYGKNLVLSRPYLTRIPDPSLIVEDRVSTSVPGAGRYRFSAARDSEGVVVRLCAGRSSVHGQARCTERSKVQGLVVQPSQRNCSVHRGVPSRGDSDLFLSGTGRESGLGTRDRRSRQELPAARCCCRPVGIIDREEPDGLRRSALMGCQNV